MCTSPTTKSRNRSDAELGAYFAELMTPEIQEDLASGDGEFGRGERLQDGSCARWASDGWLGIGWPKEYGGQGRSPDRAVRLLRRVDARRRAGADAHDQHRRPDDHAATAPRSRRSSSCPKILAGRDPLLHRLHRARRRHRPRVAADPGRARRRRVRHQRPEDLDQPAPDADYVWLAVRTDPEAKKHKGISIIIVPDRHARASRCDADRHCRRARHQRDVLRGRARAGRQPRRRGEPAAGRSSPTSSTTSGSRCARPASSSARSTTCASWAQDDQAGRRPPGDRPGVGAAQPRPGARQARVPAAHQLEGRVAARRRARCDPADASAIKVFGTEFYMEAFRLLMEVARPGGVRRARLARRGAAGPARAHATAACMILTFGGGTNEIQRDLIAIFGLGMPGRPAAEEEARRWTSRFTEEQQELAGPGRAGSSSDRSPTSSSGRSRTGDDWFDRDTWGRAGQGRPARHRACPRTSAAAASASSSVPGA